MITQEEKETLGLQGFGPEVAVYKSLLRREDVYKRQLQDRATF